MDARNTAMRGYSGTPVVPALRTAGFDPATVDVVAMSHLHFDHAGGLLLADGTRRSRGRRIVAQRAEWEIALGDNSPRRGLLRPAGAAPRGGLGRRGLGGGRPGAAPRRQRDPDRRPLRGPPGDRRPRHGPGRTVARLLRGPVHAPVVRQPALGDGVRRLPARQRRPSRASCSGAQWRRTGSSPCRTSRGCRWGSWSRTATGSGSRASRPLTCRAGPAVTASGATPRCARPRPAATAGR